MHFGAALQACKHQTEDFFFAKRNTASNTVPPNQITAVDLAAALVRVPTLNFFLTIAAYIKCNDVVLDKNGPTMVAFKRIPPNENTRPEANRDIEKKETTCNLIRLYAKHIEKRKSLKMKQLVPPLRTHINSDIPTEELIPHPRHS
jgi:hypothetical protein